LEWLVKVVFAKYIPQVLRFLWRQLSPSLHGQSDKLYKFVRQALDDSPAARLIALGFALTISGLEGIQLAHWLGFSDAIPGFMFLFGILFAIKGYDMYGTRRPPTQGQATRI